MSRLEGTAMESDSHSHRGQGVGVVMGYREGKRGRELHWE